MIPTRTSIRPLRSSSKYVDPDFRPRLPELAPYRSPVGRGVEGPSDLHNYRTGTKFYRRMLGEAAPRETTAGARPNGWAARGRDPAIQDDQAANRVKDMDDEGTDVHFLVPGGRGEPRRRSTMPRSKSG